MLLYDSQAQQEQGFDFESCHTREMLSKILNKVEESDIVLHDLKIHLTSLNLTVASHTSSIEHLKTQMGALTEQFNQVKARDVSTQSLAVLTRSGKQIDNSVEDKRKTEQVRETPVDVDATQKVVSESSQTSPVVVETESHNPLPKVHPPFPQRLKKEE